MIVAGFSDRYRSRTDEVMAMTLTVGVVRGTSIFSTWINSNHHKTNLHDLPSSSLLAGSIASFSFPATPKCISSGLTSFNSLSFFLA